MSKQQAFSFRTAVARLAAATRADETSGQGVYLALVDESGRPVTVTRPFRVDALPAFTKAIHAAADERFAATARRPA